MKDLYFILFCTLVTTSTMAQQNTVATGGDANGSNGSVSFSVGQIDYTNASGSDGSSHEGVQQPFEFYDQDAGLQELNANATLFPNPTNEFVTLSVDFVPDATNYELIDVNGKIIQSGEVVSKETSLDMRSLATGTYLLNLYQSQKAIAAIKIVKN
jgi:hypothetical protein